MGTVPMEAFADELKPTLVQDGLVLAALGVHQGQHLRVAPGLPGVAGPAA